MDIMSAQIHHRQHHILPIDGMPTVGDQFIIIDVVKYQTPVVLKGRILMTNAIDPADQFLQAIRSIQIPCPDVIFFRIEIFLAPGLLRP